MKLTPKQKAEELAIKYQRLLFCCISDKPEDEYYIHPDSIKCAIIAVDEILLLYKTNWNIENSFWQEVKSELEKKQQ